MRYSDIAIELGMKSRDEIKRTILHSIEGRVIKPGRKGYLGKADEKLLLI